MKMSARNCELSGEARAGALPPEGRHMPQFIVTKGPDSGVAFSLADAPAKLGRNPDNSVVLHDESVSRAP